MVAKRCAKSRSLVDPGQRCRKTAVPSCRRRERDGQAPAPGSFSARRPNGTPSAGISFNWFVGCAASVPLRQNGATPAGQGAVDATPPGRAARSIHEAACDHARRSVNEIVPVDGADSAEVGVFPWPVCQMRSADQTAGDRSAATAQTRHPSGACASTRRLEPEPLLNAMSRRRSARKPIASLRAAVSSAAAPARVIAGPSPMRVY